MKYACCDCSNLFEIDLASTSNVEDMSYTFYGSGTKNITGLDTSSVKNLDGAFAKSLVTNLILDCSKVTSAKGTFTDCLYLSELTLKNVSDSGILTALVTSLPIVEAGTITLENCTTTAEINTIATEKGWTVQ